MNEFENWLKSNGGDDKQPQLDSNQTIAAVHQRIAKRRTRRQVGYTGGASVLAVLALIFLLIGNPDAQIGNGNLATLDQDDIFGDTLITAVMDSTELNTLYYSSLEYLIADDDPTQPVLDINLSEADLQAFESFLEEQNS